MDCSLLVQKRKNAAARCSFCRTWGHFFKLSILKYHCLHLTCPYFEKHLTREFSYLEISLQENRHFLQLTRRDLRFPVRRCWSDGRRRGRGGGSRGGSSLKNVSPRGQNFLFPQSPPLSSRRKQPFQVYINKVIWREDLIWGQRFGAAAAYGLMQMGVTVAGGY